MQGRVEQIVQGSIVDLSTLADETFDGVLCLGARLSHILLESERVKAAKELVRVAERDGSIFAFVIGRVGVLKTIFLRVQHEMRYEEEHWETGDYIPAVNGEGLIAAHWFLPELEALFKGQGVRVLEMAGLEGLSSHHERVLNKLSKDEKNRTSG